VIDVTLMQSVALQMMEHDHICLADKTIPVDRTSYQRLRSVKFEINGHEYQAIEQNASKPSRWGQLAREGHKVVQFRDAQTGQYVAVSVDGKVREYDRS
jgi:hypothetical protein